jgi:diguanylate cyclase (GGDEF)-like protein
MTMRRLSRLSVRGGLDRVIRLVLSPAGVIAAGVFLSLGVCAVGSWSLYEAREDARVRAVQNARNLLLVVERDISRNIEMFDLSLTAVIDGVHSPAVMALPPQLRDEVLFDRAASARNLDGIVALDEHGNVMVDSRPNCSFHSNMSDREDFTVHREHPNVGLYISKPYTPRCGKGRPVISVSRRISRPDGSFGGVVSGAIAIDYFRELLQGLRIGGHGTAAVIETNGTLIARLPFDPNVIGRDLSNVDVFKMVMSANEGTFVGTASIDGTRKLYVYKRLADLPIVVDVAPAEADVYAEWRDRATYVGALMLAFSAIAISASLLFSRELKRRADAESRLHDMAHTDALTGLDNRRTFDSFIQREWRRALHTASPLSVLVADIDRFKAVNDRYGHRFGDQVLSAVAGGIAQCVRRTGDHVARYGGEEFIITLSDTDATEALIVAENIRCAVAALVVEKGDESQSVTVSIGVATQTEQWPDTADALIEQADKALYLAKAAGRDRVHAASPDLGAAATTSASTLNWRRGNV